MRVVVAPDKFKGSATAAEVAAALAAGLRHGRPDLEVVELPVADGGDGTVAAALAAGFAPVVTVAEGPAGQPVETTFALKDGTAVIELADVAGLRRLPGGEPAPLTASTYGVGQVIGAALDDGATTIVLGIGGSATTDGGAGMVQALGVRLADEHGADLARGGAALGGLAVIDPGGLDGRIGAVRFLVASDVDNPLLGPSGAAAVFGPQKGAGPADVIVLDWALARWAALTRSLTGQDLAGAAGAGAAGGTGFAALAYFGARLVAGADLVLDLIGFESALAGTALVITGEGSLDAQTLGGKAPLGVTRAAGRRGVPVAVVAGQVLLTAGELTAAGFAAAYALADIEPDQAVSMARADELLGLIGRQIAASPLVT
ncbi:MAG TPA: glycerate kinase [Streptosporangiaceae bacterium]|nr:glycerate kinase [Streptosporangiaceae bacterium]